MSEDNGGAPTGVSDISAAVAAEDAQQADAITQERADSLSATEALMEAAEAPQGGSSDSSERFFDAPRLAEMLASSDGVSEDALTYTSTVLQDRLGLSEDEAKGVIYALRSGVNAQASLAEADVFQSVGGKENFASLRTWAETALSQEDKAEYNRLSEIASTTEEYKQAVDFLHAKREERHGVAPNRDSGETPPSPAIKPIRSRSELVRLMSDSRYETEPGFRAAVDQRLNEGVRLGVYDIMNK